MKIKVAQGVQVVHDGTVYADGETVDVPDDVAPFWIRSQWASEVKLPAATGRPKGARP